MSVLVAVGLDVALAEPRTSAHPVVGRASWRAFPAGRAARLVPCCAIGRCGRCCRHGMLLAEVVLDEVIYRSTTAGSRPIRWGGDPGPGGTDRRVLHRSQRPTRAGRPRRHRDAQGRARVRNRGPRPARARPPAARGTPTTTTATGGSLQEASTPRSMCSARTGHRRARRHGRRPGRELAVAGVLLRSRRRRGGVAGDVLGASVELTLAGYLVRLVLAPVGSWSG